MDGEYGEYEGGLLGFGQGGLVGWAWAPARPHEVADVEVLLDDVVCGVGRGEVFDERLAARQIGNGSHGFRVLVTALPAHRPTSVSLRVPGTCRILATHPIAGDAELVAIVAPVARFEGFVDGIRHGELVGWAFDRVTPKTRVRVAVVEGAEAVLTVTADRFRDDLQQQGKGDGRAGFHAPLPIAALDGRDHTYRVMVEGTELELLPGPFTIDRAEAVRALSEVVPDELLRQRLTRQT